jgi:nucleoside-diphosphate-sugar epimerase
MKKRATPPSLVTDHSRVQARPRFGAPRLLIVGCGEVGLRIVSRVRRRLRVFALTSTAARAPLLRAAGALPIAGNLDCGASLRRLRALAPWLIHLAPPPDRGRDDPRTRSLLSVLKRPRRAVYVSTTGVYGDRGGQWIDETAAPAPANDRGWRRLRAESAMRTVGAAVLRAPGIYAHDRLPLARLRAGTPALAPADDVHTNHIHADDLARIALAALLRGRRARVYHAVDDTQLKMGEYFDAVADACGLARPPRLPRAQLQQSVSPTQYSFMTESRRLRNRRIKQELRLRLRWPTVAATLATLPAV